MLRKMDEGEIITNAFPQNLTASAASNSNNNPPPALKRKRNLPGNPGMLVSLIFRLSVFSSVYSKLICFFIKRKEKSSTNDLICESFYLHRS
ncbi:unnamed protein product [Sphenostylis stenocarpa]|uniref:Uncharacterized protein n=1 Tax=Sphenostylis stenocarpa TaxID=92480 RepID=A0AA86W6F3_9FABA|nr:unnamed protein product [Sphenostylis stenocarpa]